MNRKLVYGGMTAVALFATLTSCDRDTSTLEPALFNTDPLVFDDTFAPGTDYQAFLFSTVTAISLDRLETIEGSASIRVDVPGPESFAGGAIVGRRSPESLRLQRAHVLGHV